ncbi:MAG: helix-turn-helix domain-containing protein [Chloroflexi bacterium]|nr:helix-turn-helix domain-containing protein [Chloroflexota bacterium]MCI0855494.1 helix-turn-helix domain-containing protein [Chloroflexota bacterium]MCI0889565.1 helix-turn-helix domain-containing protein [Chloroflexota bacterium]
MRPNLKAPERSKCWWKSCLDDGTSVDELALALWGSAGDRKRLRLGVLLCRLRAKLAASDPYRFETVRGRGYGLLAPRRGGS